MVVEIDQDFLFGDTESVYAEGSNSPEIKFEKPSFDEEYRLETSEIDGTYLEDIVIKLSNIFHT